MKGVATMLKIIITNREEARELRNALKKTRCGETGAAICDASGRQIGFYFSEFGFRSTCYDAMNAVAHYYKLMAIKAERDWVKLTRPTR